VSAEGTGRPRSRASARAAGTRAETAVAGYLAAQLEDDRIERRARNGAKDRGDIGGVRTATGGRVVLEVKDVVATNLGGWVAEAEAERGNDDAAVGLVVHKRRGKGDPGDWYVTGTLRDLVALLCGERPA
jgi:hypothetical protein